MTQQNKLPILYSFRRCPYAMRARMALVYAGVQCEVREVVLKNKPRSLLLASEKATVPVLLNGDEVIDESLQIMHWALSQSNPEGLSLVDLTHPLVAANDGEFKDQLDHYKYHDRYPELTQSDYFNLSLKYLSQLEESLIDNGNQTYFLLSPQLSPMDMAIFPFIRQFAHVDLARFMALKFDRLKAWYQQQLCSPLFESSMRKYPAWAEGQTAILLRS